MYFARIENFIHNFTPIAVQGRIQHKSSQFQTIETKKMTNSGSLTSKITSEGTLQITPECDLQIIHHLEDTPTWYPQTLTL